MNKRLVWAAATALLAVAMACGSWGDSNGQPSPEIVGQNIREGSVSFEYMVWVDCTVRNNGAAGDVEVTAKLENGQSWSKSQPLPLAAGAEKRVPFTFAEATQLDAGLSGYQYGCSVATPP